MHEKLARFDIGVSCDSVAESAQVHAMDTPEEWNEIALLLGRG
jgi:hypothetical protein